MCIRDSTNFLQHAGGLKKKTSLPGRGESCGPKTKIKNTTENTLELPMNTHSQTKIARTKKAKKEGGNTARNNEQEQEKEHVTIASF